MNKKETDSSEKYMLKFLKIAFGVVVFALIFPFIVNFFFSDWKDSGAFGDTFGALNAIFSGLAFAGVIVTILIQKSELKLQREELKLQRNEMKETRTEFLTNRTINLVYKQLDRFEKSVDELIIIDINGNQYKGNDAISFLDKNKVNFPTGFEQTPEEYADEMKTITIKLLKLYNPNKSQIEKFAYTAYNSVEVVQRLIFKSNLEVEELNDIKNLFFENIGFINMHVIENISDASTNELKYLIPEDWYSNHLEIAQLIHADIFLRAIVKFFRCRLAHDNFAELKNEWLKNKRGDA